MHFSSSVSRRWRNTGEDRVLCLQIVAPVPFGLVALFLEQTRI
jgi:hypothetical protein